MFPGDHSSGKYSRVNRFSTHWQGPAGAPCRGLTRLPLGWRCAEQAVVHPVLHTPILGTLFYELSPLTVSVPLPIAGWKYDKYVYM